MKKIVLFISIITCSLSSFGQCNADLSLMDSLFGVWPDTLTNFPPAQLNMAYSTQLDVRIPADASVVNPAFQLPVDSGFVADVIGMPPGLSYVCNSQTGAFCTFLGDTVGCAVIEGTPTVAGVYPLVIEMTGYVTFAGFATPVPLTFTGYKIVVSEPSGIGEALTAKLELSQNIPNPFETITNIPFSVPNAGEVEIIVSTLLGKKLISTKLQAEAGDNSYEFDASLIGSGLYLYSISTGDQKITRKMFVKK